MAISGGVARDIIGAMRNALATLPSEDCVGASGVSQDRGAPVAESQRSHSLGKLATPKNGRCRALLFGAICVARWNINDCFEKRSRVMIELLDHESTDRFLMRIFMEAMEMGAVAERFPHATFTIGGGAETWSAQRRGQRHASLISSPMLRVSVSRSPGTTWRRVSMTTLPSVISCRQMDGTMPRGQRINRR
jgi:hypothetical protein